MHWRENDLLAAMQEEKLTTSEIVSRVTMCKATALKYLGELQEKGLVDCEMIGPTKVWFLKNNSDKQQKKIKVLVVDDDENVITIIQDFLEPYPFEVFDATNGKEAIGMAFAKSPDVIVLDIMMPHMNGYMVCEELKKHDHTKDIPVIILSARTSVEDKLKAMEMGINDYIGKPFDPRELEARIKMVLKQTS
ncbi:MAG: response regulator [Methanosarcinaceae archaeon]|nr:response regulator [Methanosarcinaceae archaeon]